LLVDGKNRQYKLGMFNWVEDGENPLSGMTIDQTQMKRDINFLQNLEFDSKLTR